MSDTETPAGTYRCLSCGRVVEIEEGDTLPRDTERCSHEFEAVPTDPQDAHDILTPHRITVEVSRQDVEWMIALLAEREHLVVSLADLGKYQDKDPDATADMLGDVQSLVCRLRAALPPLPNAPAPVNQPDDPRIPL